MPTPDACASIFIRPPTHAGPSLVAAVVGPGLTVTLVVPTATQPDDVLLAVTVYIPLIGIVTLVRVGLDTAEV